MNATNINFDKYKFQKDGKVWSVSRECYKTPQIIRGGYLGSTFVCKDGKLHPFKIHRVIAELFCEIPEHLKNVPIEQLDVDHKNGNRTDNRSCNLRWCTRRENCNYELSKNNKSNSHKDTIVPNRWKKVVQYTKDGVVIKEWESITSASNGTNTLASSISNCCKGKAKTANNFQWKYK